MVTNVSTSANARAPVPRTPLIGRESDVARVIELLGQRETSILTISGPGGVGKTRVALQVAAIAGDFFPDGVVFVPLAPVRDADDVPAAIGHAIGIRDAGAEPLHEQIVEALDGLHVLLVLDNFEHVAASAPFVADLAMALPSMTALVTSRERLHISTERVYPLTSLRVPKKSHDLPADQLEDFAAIRLFVDRAKAVSPAFELDEQNASAIVDVCRRLDGLPLAIELAAARSTMLSPEDLSDRMNSSFLSTLTSISLDRPARQQTLQATIAWSYDLLAPDEQQFLNCLSVFRGGFSLDAVEAVFGVAGHGEMDAFAGIASLLDKSLLRRLEATGDEPRYELLETIRAFAQDRRAESGRSDEFHHRHAEWCVTLAVAAERELRRSDQGLWLARLEAEHDNLRVALAWTIEHNSELCIRLANALWLFWYLRGHLAEGQRWLERAIANGADAPLALYARAVNNHGTLVYELGDLARARKLYEQSLELRQQMDDQASVAISLNNLGMLATARGAYSQARELLESSLELQPVLNQPHLVPLTMNNLGDVAIAEGDASDAQHWNELALAMSRELNDTRRIAHSLRNLGLAKRCAGEDAAAVALFQHSLQLFLEINDKAGAAAAHQSLGRVAMREANGERARSHLASALAYHRQVMHRRGLALCLEEVALLVESEGQLTACARLFGAGETIRGQMLPPQPPVDRIEVEATIARVRSQLGDAAFEAHWLTGASLSWDRAIDAACASLCGTTTAGLDLSRREREVLQLISEGQSNQQIADRLYISVRTVKAHVTNILTKLDVPSRSAAAAYAHRNGLV